MRRLAVISLLVLMSCGGPPVPVNTMLWRIDEEWIDAGGGIRTSRGTIIVFRASNEYVELHTALIERPDKTVYIQAGRGRIAVVGRWEKKGRDIVATRQRVARSARQLPSSEPLCAQPRLTFRLDKTGKTVNGNAGGEGEGTYAPVTRFISVDFESYVESAKTSPVTCAPPPP